MSKARAVVLLVLVVAGSLAAAIIRYGIGAVLLTALIVVLSIAGFIALAMNTGQYEGATEAVAKSIDAVLSRARAFVRRAWPPD